MTPLRGFMPVLTYRFPLDALLLPYVERFSPAVLLSVPELRHRGERPLPRLPLLIDSGGYAALDPANQVVAEDGLGVLILSDGARITPQGVHELQAAHAHIGFTLDFPAPGAG